MNYHLDIGLIRGWALMKKPPQEVVDAINRLSEFDFNDKPMLVRELPAIPATDILKDTAAIRRILEETPASEFHDDERSERSLKEHAEPAHRPSGKEARRPVGN